MLPLSHSEFFHFELLRILTTAPFGGADISEFLTAVDEIRDNPEKWHHVWRTRAERAQDHAHAAAKAGDTVAARRGFLRACNYFRAAQYLMFEQDARMMPLYDLSVANFQLATQLFECRVEALSIPYLDDMNRQKKHLLPAYLYHPAPLRRLPGKIPLVLNVGGADSTHEENYFVFPVAGVELGYAQLSFDGPGQGIVLRKQGLRHRPDWERVVSAVLDYVEQYAAAHPEAELDLDRIAIAGASMGGYYALRGAGDARIKAAVSIDPFYSLWDFIVSRLPKGFVNLWLSGWVSDALFDALAAIPPYLSFQSKWEYNMSRWMFGVSTPSMLFRRVRQFTFEMGGGEDYLGRIKCPTLVTGAASSLYFKPEESTTKICDRLVSLREDQKQVWIPVETSQGGLQAKMGALGLLHHRTFAFLDGAFGIKRENPLKCN